MIPIDNSFIYGEGASFSNKYFYAANGGYIYQYDLSNEKPLRHGRRVAEYDGYKYFFPWDTMQVAGKRTNFTYLASGPDGRIYICPTPASLRMMGVMHYPDEEGIACDVRQHSLLMPTMFARGIPNFPHYRLGPLDGSSCDTLGMDSHPVAKFRYEADSLDHLDIRFTDLSYFRPEIWTWDFGDGSAAVTTQHPYHTYERNGNYRVCLTVRNENTRERFLARSHQAALRVPMMHSIFRS